MGIAAVVGARVSKWAIILVGVCVCMCGFSNELTFVFKFIILVVQKTNYSYDWIMFGGLDVSRVTSPLVGFR